MGREILFKGKRTDNGEWAKGFWFKLYCDGSFYWCVGNEPLHPNDYSELGGEGIDWFKIDENTICQYTGLKDKNGKDIYEGDIVEIIWHSRRIERYLIWWCKEMSMMTSVSLKDIEFNGCDYFGGNPKIEYSDFCLRMQDPWGDIKEVKVIGNIFDNPELLGGDSD